MSENDQLPDLDTMQRETPALLDGYFYRILKQGGMKVISEYRKDGSAVIELIDPPSAFFNVVRQRVKDLKMGGVAIPGSATASLEEAARLRFQGRPIPKMPPLDTRRDDAATG